MRLFIKNKIIKWGCLPLNITVIDLAYLYLHQTVQQSSFVAFMFSYLNSASNKHSSRKLVPHKQISVCIGKTLIDGGCLNTVFTYMQYIGHV